MPDDEAVIRAIADSFLADLAEREQPVDEGRAVEVLVGAIGNLELEIERGVKLTLRPPDAALYAAPGSVCARGNCAEPCGDDGRCAR